MSKKSLIISLLVLILLPLKTGAVSKGAVSDVQGDYAILTLGSLDGVKVGDRLLIYRRESLIHPLTGEVFELPRVRVAEVEVREVGNLFSVAASVEVEMPVRRGDLVMLVGAPETWGGEKMVVADTTGAKMAVVPPEAGRRKTISKHVRRKSVPRKTRPDVRVAKRARPAEQDTTMTAGMTSRTPAGGVTTPVGEELNTRYQEALTFLKQPGKGRGPKTIDAYYWAGQYHFRMRNYAKAAEHFKKVVEVRTDASKRYNALFNLAMCYYQMNKGEPAQLGQSKEIFQQVVREFPNTPIALEASQWIETIEWLQRVEMKQQKQETVPPKSPTAVLTGEKS